MYHVFKILLVLQTDSVTEKQKIRYYEQL